jgi:hypothetical protein
MPATPYIAFDPATGLVYGVGRSAAEARDDAEFQAGVLVGATPPWRSLDTRPCTTREALEVDRANGPLSLAQLGRAA